MHFVFKHEEHLTHLETEIANREGYPVDTREEDECFTDGPDFAHSEDTIMPDSFPSTAKQGGNSSIICRLLRFRYSYSHSGRKLDNA